MSTSLASAHNTADPLFSYPRQAAFGRVLPKSKIYEHSRANGRLKALFVAQVERITWSYKLAPETLNISASKQVPEIQVFSIALKAPTLHEDVLRCIDSAVQYPVLFELTYEGKVQLKACYKRPAAGKGQGGNPASSKWQGSDYFASPWLKDDTPRKPMPIALNMTALYEQLLRQLIPLAAREKESLADLVERAGQVRAKQKEIEQVQARLGRERQFNRKVEINAQLRQLKTEFDELSY